MIRFNLFASDCIRSCEQYPNSGCSGSGTNIRQQVHEQLLCRVRLPVASLKRSQRIRQVNDGHDCRAVYSSGTRQNLVSAFTFGLSQSVIYFLYTATFIFGSWLIDRGEMDFLNVLRWVLVTALIVFQVLLFVPLHRFIFIVARVCAECSPRYRSAPCHSVVPWAMRLTIRRAGCLLPRCLLCWIENLQSMCAPVQAEPW
jgi:hypothetical protein